MDVFMKYYLPLTPNSRTLSFLGRKQYNLWDISGLCPGAISDVAIKDGREGKQQA